MKKSKKLIKIIAITLMFTASASLWAGSQIFGVTPYNMNAENILDNLSREGDKVVIPIVYSEPDNPITLNKIKADFKAKGLTIKKISTDVIGTGTQITTNENKITYNMLVYGDVNGDGEVDLVDAQKIILGVKDSENKALDGLNLIAGNVAAEDNEVDLVDAQRIILFLKQSKELMSILPTLNQADIEKPVIYVKGSTKETLEIGDTYTEKGATAEDDFDGNIADQVKISGSVNTSKAGTYTIKYDVTDKAGNKADTKTRTITVIDTIREIQKEAGLTKTEYNFAEEIDLTGAKVKAIYKSGKEKIITDTSKFEVVNFDSKTPGEQVIGIKYEGFTISEFDTLKVKNKISKIAINTSTLDGATLSPEADKITSATSTLIKVQTNKEFTLGNIEGVGEDLSTLDVDKLSIEVTSINRNDVESKSVDGGVVKAKISSNKPGLYTFRIKYVNENNEDVLLIMPNILAETNGIATRIELTNPEDYAVRSDNSDYNEDIFEDLKVYNENNEQMALTPDDITIEMTNGDNVSITKCNKLEEEITSISTDKIVTKLGYATTYAGEKDVTYKVTVETSAMRSKGTQAISTEEYTLKIGKPRDITGIENIPSMLEINEGSITYLDLDIKEYYEKDFDLKASKIFASIVDDDAYEIFEESSNYKVGIKAPFPINKITMYNGNTKVSNSSSTANVTKIGFEFQENYKTNGSYDSDPDTGTIAKINNGDNKITIYIKTASSATPISYDIPVKANTSNQ